MGIALRNAGFGLQFGAASDSFDAPVVDELGGIIWSGGPEGTSEEGALSPQSAPAPAPTPPQPEETTLEQALKKPRPIAKCLLQYIYGQRHGSQPCLFPHCCRSC